MSEHLWEYDSNGVPTVTVRKVCGHVVTITAPGFDYDPLGIEEWLGDVAREAQIEAWEREPCWRAECQGGEG